MDQNAKQLAVERLKNSANVLVTVSQNPTVDDLSALIGFSLLLGKLGKHASAVFSGQIPPAIAFLQPEKRLEKDVSSLRDFIIALDKNKADKLRYKVEDDVVRIFITPYKSHITQEDLKFSEGDFNVDTIVALGVSKRDDLDNAIKAHGRILHDAAVVTVNSGSNTSDLGSIDWQDPAASSLCEMLVSISESFGSGLLDEQISTAFLTGIVAATDRFSNPKTSPKVMTMAAQLMAAGANQQLISNNLQPAPAATAPSTPPAPSDNSQLSIDHGDKPAVQPAPPPSAEVELPKPQAVSSLPSDKPPAPPLPASADKESHDKSLKQLEDEIAKMAKGAKASKKSILPPPPDNNPQKSPKIETKPHMLPPQPPPSNQDEEDKPDEHEPGHEGLIGHPKGHGPREIDEDPLMGGTFNATSQQAHDESVSELKKNVNSTILNHPDKPLEENQEPKQTKPEAKAPTLQPLSMSQPPVGPPSPPEPKALPSPPPVPPPDSSTPAIDVEAARKEVEAAVNSQDFSPSNNPLESIGAQPLPGEQPDSNPEIAIDPNGNLQQPGQTTSPSGGDTNQEFKLP